MIKKTIKFSVSDLSEEENPQLKDPTIFWRQIMPESNTKVEFKFKLSLNSLNIFSKCWLDIRFKLAKESNTVRKNNLYINCPPNSLSNAQTDSFLPSYYTLPSHINIFFRI